MIFVIKFFIDNFNWFVKVLDGMLKEFEKYNLYWGLLMLVWQLDEIQNVQW